MTTPNPWLAPEDFARACAALPLVSIDHYVLRPVQGELALLLGKRRNRPAQGWWFTPGGRIRKNEPLAAADVRIGQGELGLPTHAGQRSGLLGVWDHFYPDSAFDAHTSTHYMNLVFAVLLDDDAARRLPLSVGLDDQHEAWRWARLSTVAGDADIHPHVKLALPNLQNWLHQLSPQPCSD